MRKIAIASVALFVAGFLTYLPTRFASAQQPAKPAEPPKCAKTFGSAKCCDPAVMEHLAKEAVFKACGESEATFLGEAGSKETCKYVFKVAGEKEEETYVQVYAPTVKEVPEKPTDPFFSYKKVGKAWMADKVKSPKAAAMAANFTGLYLAGKGYLVSVSASNKVCTKSEATRLASSMK